MKHLALIAVMVFWSLCAYAQNVRTISGQITDYATGEALQGVGVMEDGTTNGVTTGADGRYVIKIKGDKAVLRFVYLGYLTQTAEIPDKAAIFNYAMKSDAQMLEGTVVTALGITRDEKSLGYSVAKINGEDMDNSAGGNWLSGISGKVAGLDIEQSNSGPDGSVRVTLRGESSLSYDNNGVLFVVDGVPVSTSSVSNSSGSVYQNNDAPVDYGGGSVDINPEDIESMTVLKGASATALYGSRAANGAIVITTKKASRQQNGIDVSYSGGVFWEVPGYFPDIQSEYGAGDLRLSTIAGHLTEGVVDEFSFYTVPADKSYSGKEVKSFNSRYQFGEKIEGQERYIYSSYNPDTGEYTRLPFVANNHMKDFFQTGFTYQNGIAVNAAFGKGASIRFSFKDTRNKWIVPNTGYSSQTFNINASTGQRKYVDAKFSMVYYRKDSDNLPMSGYSDCGLIKSLMWGNACASMADYWHEYESGYVEKYWDGTLPKGVKLISVQNDNPYFIVYRHLNTLDRDRVYGNASVTGHIIPGMLDLMIRGALNYQGDFRTQQRPQYSVSAMRGMYREQTTRFVETNIDFLLSFRKTFAGQYHLKASFGGNMMLQEKNNVNLYAAQLSEPNVFMIQNVNGTLSVSNPRYSKAINSLYGLVSFSYRDMFFIEATGRNDWSSTLAPGHNSYFYPSVNTSLILDKIFKIKSKDVDMLKLFGSYACVGNDTDPYRILDGYTNSTRFTGAYSIPTVTADYYVKPEETQSFETGIQTSFFRHRIGFDATFYNNDTKNQIINLPQDWASGAGSTLTNAGRIRNRGVELAAHFLLVDKRMFKWSLDLNWAYNKNTLVELVPGVNSWQMSALLGGKVIVYGFPGQDMGRIYGTGIEKAPEGAYYIDASGNRVDCSGMDIVNAKTGNPVRSSEPKDLGSIFPDWTGGLSTTLRYRTFTLSASFAASVGGKAYSLTNAILSYMGKTKSTLPGRYDGLVHTGVNLNEDGTYSLNTTKTTDVVEYYNLYVYNRDNIECNVFSTSYFKCKEIRLAYSLPKKYCRQSKVFQGVNISVYATNVFCITEWPQFNPDVASLSGSSLYRGAETGALPMTRSYGINLKLDF